MITFEYKGIKIDADDVQDAALLLLELAGEVNGRAEPVPPLPEATIAPRSRKPARNRVKQFDITDRRFDGKYKRSTKGAEILREFTRCRGLVEKEGVDRYGVHHYHSVLKVWAIADRLCIASKPILSRDLAKSLGIPVGSLTGVTGRFKRLAHDSGINASEIFLHGRLGVDAAWVAQSRMPAIIAALEDRS